MPSNKTPTGEGDDVLSPPSCAIEDPVIKDGTITIANRGQSILKTNDAGPKLQMSKFTRKTAPDYARLGALKSYLDKYIQAIECGNFFYKDGQATKSQKRVPVDSLPDSEPNSEGMHNRNLNLTVTRLKAISDAFKLSWDVLLDSRGDWARILDASNLPETLTVAENHHDVSLDKIIEHLKEQTRQKLEIPDHEELREREMGNVARMIIYRCMSEIERYSRPSGNRNELAVFSLAVPDFHCPRQQEQDDISDYLDQEQPKKTQVPMYLGSRRLLQQSLYEFCEKYLSINIYDTEDIKNRLRKGATTSGPIWEWFKEVYRDRPSGSIRAGEQTIIFGLTQALSLLPDTFRDLYRELERLHPRLAQVVGDRTLRDQTVDPFGLLGMDSQALATIGSEAGHPTDDPENDNALNPGEEETPISLMRGSQVTRYAYIDFLMGCAIILIPKCLHAALRYEDEVFVLGQSQESLPHQFLADPVPGTIPYALNLLLNGDNDSILDFYSRMNTIVTGMGNLKRAKLLDQDKINANVIQNNRHLFSIIPESSGTYKKQKLGTDISSTGHQSAGRSATRPAKRGSTGRGSTGRGSRGKSAGKTTSRRQAVTSEQATSSGTPAFQGMHVNNNDNAEGEEVIANQEAAAQQLTTAAWPVNFMPQQGVSGQGLTVAFPSLNPQLTGAQPVNFMTPGTVANQVFPPANLPTNAPMAHNLLASASGGGAPYDGDFGTTIEAIGGLDVPIDFMQFWDTHFPSGYGQPEPGHQPDFVQGSSTTNFDVGDSGINMNDLLGRNPF